MNKNLDTKIADALVGIELILRVRGEPDTDGYISRATEAIKKLVEEQKTTKAPLSYTSKKNNRTYWLYYKAVSFRYTGRKSKIYFFSPWQEYAGATKLYRVPKGCTIVENTRTGLPFLTFTPTQPTKDKKEK